MHDVDAPAGRLDGRVPDDAQVSALQDDGEEAGDGVDGQDDHDGYDQDPVLDASGDAQEEESDRLFDEQGDEQVDWLSEEVEVHPCAEYIWFDVLPVSAGLSACSRKVIDDCRSPSPSVLHFKDHDDHPDDAQQRSYTHHVVLLQSQAMVMDKNALCGLTSHPILRIIRLRT